MKRHWFPLIKMIQAYTQKIAGFFHLHQFSGSYKETKQIDGVGVGGLSRHEIAFWKDGKHFNDRKWKDGGHFNDRKRPEMMDVRLQGNLKEGEGGWQWRVTRVGDDEPR